MDRTRRQVSRRHSASKSIDPTQIPRSTAAALLSWFDRVARDLPWRQNPDPYGIWVSEIMLQQTQVRTVIPYWERWMKTLPDVRALARSDEAMVLKLWEGLGYYSRARNLRKAAQVLVERGETRLPGSVEGLLELPGIGPYTAGAIASIAFDQPAPILDGNVIRVLSRVHALPGDPKRRETNARLWALAESWVRGAGGCTNSKGRARYGDLNQALMELGATVCTPTQPACPDCPLADACTGRKAGSPERYPEIPPRAKPESRWFATLVIRHRTKFWLRQRGQGDVNAGFWEFPNLELASAAADPVSALADLFRLEADRLRPLGELRHSITKYRMTQKVFAMEWRGGLRNADRLGEGQWVSEAELEALALTGSHRTLCGKPWFADWVQQLEVDV
jgi:A/G-specific adenine glycosylase